MDPDDVRPADLDGDGDGELIRMAKCEYSGFDAIEAQLGKLNRDTIREIVMAGAEACGVETRSRTEQARHVKNRDMLNSVAPAKYHEDVNSGWVEVYPQGYDRRGVSNAKKAFVINYGYGGRRTKRTGDKFITGQKNRMEEAVKKAMQAESDRIIQSINGG